MTGLNVVGPAGSEASSARLGGPFSAVTVIMGTRKKCSLRLFTWVALGLQGLEHVTPTCPLHGHLKVRSATFENTLTFICRQGEEHALNQCTLEEFKAEEKEASGKLYSKMAKAAATG